MLVQKPNVYCSNEDKKQGWKDQARPRLVLHVSPRPTGTGLLPGRTFYKSELKVEWAATEVVSLPSLGLFKQEVFPNRRLDNINIPLGVSSLSHLPLPTPSLRHTPFPPASSPQPQTFHLSVFDHTASSAEMSMSSFYTSGLQNTFIDLFKCFSLTSHTPSRFGDLSSTLPCN